MPGTVASGEAEVSEQMSPSAGPPRRTPLADHHDLSHAIWNLVLDDPPTRSSVLKIVRTLLAVVVPSLILLELGLLFVLVSLAQSVTAIEPRLATVLTGMGVAITGLIATLCHKLRQKKDQAGQKGQGGDDHPNGGLPEDDQ